MGGARNFFGGASQWDFQAGHKIPNSEQPQTATVEQLTVHLHNCAYTHMLQLFIDSR